MCVCVCEFLNENIVELTRTFNQKFPMYNYVSNKIVI